MVTTLEELQALGEHVRNLGVLAVGLPMEGVTEEVAEALQRPKDIQYDQQPRGEGRLAWDVVVLQETHLQDSWEVRNARGTGQLDGPSGATNKKAW